MNYVRPSVVAVKQAVNAISTGANGSNPLTKNGALLESLGPPALSRSTSGAYQSDE